MDLDAILDMAEKLDNESHGRGKKKCPKCNTVQAARSSKCTNEECNHIFYEAKTEVKKEPTIFKEAGRGRKECPECNNYVGARSEICPSCSFDFKTTPTKKKRTLREQAAIDITDDLRHYMNVMGAYGCVLVYTPSGRLPWRISTIDQKTVFKFCDHIVQEGLKENRLYTPQAIKYIGQSFLGANTSDCADYAKYVEEWYQTVISSEPVVETI